MALISLPDPFGIRSIAWDIDRPASLNQSVYTGSTVVGSTPWFGRWSAKVTLAPIVGEDKVRPIRAFVLALRGQVNTFRMPATEGGQKHLPRGTSSAAAAGAISLTLTGCLLEPGHLFTVNDELKQVVAVSGATVTFEPPLRAAVSAGSAVEVGNPTCLVRLASSSVGWSVDPGQVYSCSFDVQEAF